MIYFNIENYNLLTNTEKVYVNVENLPLNTSYWDFGGYEANKTLYFYSTWVKDSITDEKELYEWNNEPFLNIFESDTKIPGLYSIQVDGQGERSFTYWRENSAARQVMQFIDNAVVNQLAKGDVFFFSGISLAVIDPDARTDFWTMIEKLKAAGVSIVFDPNYRARMWDSQSQAKAQFEQAFSYADILLPGVDDFEQLYGLSSSEAVYNFCKPYQFKELVIKNGEAGIFCYADELAYHFPITPIKNVIDTTSAGDSFNGVYLGARTTGFTLSEAIELAAKAAGFVIQHRGAIVEQQAYQDFIDKQNLNTLIKG